MPLRKKLLFFNVSEKKVLKNQLQDTAKSVKYKLFARVDMYEQSDIRLLINWTINSAVAT